MDGTSIFVLVLSVLMASLWWSLVNFEKFGEAKASSVAFWSNAHSLHWLSEILSHSAFYGSFVVGLLGVRKESFFAYCIATWWFFFMLNQSHRLIMRIETLSPEKRATFTLRKETPNGQ